jgi:prevent-host-death family protein
MEADMSTQVVEVPIRDLRAHLSDYIDMAGRGSTIVVTSHGKPVARLIPPEASTSVPFGALAGQIRMAPDFDQTPADIIDAMENGGL